MNFGARLKMARTAAGLNQKELGEKVGVTGNAISNYENGTSAPNDRVLLLLFDALGVEPNFLFQDSFEKKAPAEQEPKKELDYIINCFQHANAYGRKLLLHTACYIAQAGGESERRLTDNEVEMEILAAIDRLPDSQSDIREADR